jgi:hypothetical protein
MLGGWLAVRSLGERGRPSPQEFVGMKYWKEDLYQFNKIWPPYSLAVVCGEAVVFLLFPSLGANSSILQPGMNCWLS